MGWAQRRHIIVVSSRRPYLEARRKSLIFLFCAVAVPLVVDLVRQAGAKRLHTSELGLVVAAYQLEAASRKAHGQGLCSVVRGASMGLLLGHWLRERHRPVQGSSSC